MIALAIASSIDVTRPAGGGVSVHIAFGTVAIAAIALIWLPALLRLLSLTGGTFKAGGVEASASGLLGAPEDLIDRLVNIRTGAETLARTARHSLSLVARSSRRSS
jgi:hypothetical protein